MIQVSVPATSANCCVGFDSMGMALNWCGTFCFEKADELQISGCPEEYQDENNLVVQAFKKACTYLHEELPAFHLHIDSEIPFARGMGSSATCVVAGIVAANAWFHDRMSKEEMLQLATEMEGHPDNVAPALFGGTTACFMQDGNIYMESIDAKDWYGLAMVPEYPVSTAEARKVLPKQMEYKEACKQVGYAIVFIQALQKGQEELLSKACVDFLHEPYRKKLIPDYEMIHSYCVQQEMPMWISGSGSTMLALSKSEDKIEKLHEYLKTLNTIQCRRVEISKKGAVVLNV